MITALAHRSSKKSRALIISAFSLLALTFLAPVMTLKPAQAKETQKPVPTLSVSGTGIINTEPDVAFISSGVVSEAKTAEDALRDNNNKMDAIFDVLTKQGIERKHIRTSNFSVQPRYRHHRPKPGEIQKPPKIVGYTVNNTVTVKVVDLEKLGQTITEVVKFGSNQLGNIRFDVSNKKALLDEARKAAVLDAKRKAEIYTSAAGVTIGRLVALSEGSRGIVRPKVQQFARTAAVAEDVATPVSAGEQQLSFTVSITWEIDQ